MDIRKALKDQHIPTSVKDLWGGDVPIQPGLVLRLLNFLRQSPIHLRNRSWNRICGTRFFFWNNRLMPNPSKKNGRSKQEKRKVLSKWKKTITAEAGRRLRGKPRQGVPDTSAIPWLRAK